MLKKITRKLLPQIITKKVSEIHGNYFNGHSRYCFSTEGEDMILDVIFGDKSDGFYVDIGAHHPKKYSNTYYFYKRGWRGINIDAMPGSMDLFNKLRPKDINIEQAIFNEDKVLPYYIFNEPAYNGFSKELTERRQRTYQNCSVIKTINLKTKKLHEILDQHVSLDQHIDFFSIDAEGLDLQVLKSNNWEIYRPDIVLAEVANCSMVNVSNNELTQYMEKQNYSLICKLINTLIFRRNGADCRV